MDHCTLVRIPIWNIYKLQFFLILLIAPAWAGGWFESFDGKQLGSEWDVDRSPHSQGELKLLNGRLQLTAEEGLYHHVERNLGLDGTDEAPLIVECQICNESDKPVKGLPTLLALYWSPEELIGIGPTAVNHRFESAGARWVIGGKPGARNSHQQILPGTIGHYRLIINNSTVSAWASQDGITYWKVVSFERKEGQFAGPPDRLIVGRGWIHDNSKAPPQLDLDNDARNSSKGQYPNSWTFDSLRVTNEPPVDPPLPPGDYRKSDSWAEALEEYRKRSYVSKWHVLGPMRPQKAEFGPERRVDLAEQFKLHDGKQGGWKEHTVDERAVHRPLNLLFHLQGVQRDSIAFATTVIQTDRAHDERLWFDAEYTLDLFVNGWGVARLSDHHTETLVHDSATALVSFVKGENRIVARVSRRRNALGLAFRHVPANPRSRIALLRQLMKDFPQEKDKTAEALSEIAGLWESAGYHLKAARSLGAIVAYSGATMEQKQRATVSQEQLYRFIGDERRAIEARWDFASQFPSGGEQWLQVSLEALKVEVRLGNQEKIDKAVSRLVQQSSDRPERTIRIHGLLAGAFEERKDDEKRKAHLKKMVELAEGKHFSTYPADALHVELAEVILKPIRSLAILKEKPLDEAILRTGLGHYRKAIGLVHDPADVRTADYLKRAEKALTAGEQRAALRLFPVTYLRALISQSPSGRKLLKEAESISLPDLPGDSWAVRRAIEKYFNDYGRILEWNVAGAFPATTEDLIKPGEMNLQRPVKDKSWQKARVDGNGYIMFEKLLKQRNGAALVQQTYQSPAAEKNDIYVYSCGPFKLWHNGQKVYEDNVSRGWQPQPIQIVVRMSKGANTFLMQVQDSGGWALSMRVGRDIRYLKDLVLGLTTIERFSEQRNTEAMAGLFANSAYNLLNARMTEESIAVARAAIRAFPEAPVHSVRFASLFMERCTKPILNLSSVHLVENELEMLREHRPIARSALRENHNRIVNSLWKAGELDLTAQWMRWLSWTEADDLTIARSHMSMAEYYRWAGLPRLAEAEYKNALRRRGLDENTRRSARNELNVIRHLKPILPEFDLSFDASTILETADRAAEQGDARGALQSWQTAIDRHPGELVRAGPDRVVGIAEYCAGRIRSLDEKGRAAYRELYGGRARALYKRASEAADLDMLEELVRRFPYADVADDALNNAANLHIDAGRFSQAAGLLNQIITQHPRTNLNPSLLLAKFAFASRKAGDVGRARRALNLLAIHYGEDPLNVGGGLWKGKDYSAAQLKALKAGGASKENTKTWPTLGGSTRRTGRSHHSPDPVQVAFETRIPAHRFPVSTTMLLPKSTLKYVPVHGCIDESSIYFHNWQETFSVDLSTGKMRWRTGRYLETQYHPAAYLPAITVWPEFTGYPQAVTTVAGRRVFARQISTPGDFSFPVFHIEARDALNGGLLWSSESLKQLRGLSAVSPPAVTAGKVYAIYRNLVDADVIYAAAFQVSTGRFLWRKQILRGQAALPRSDQRIRMDNHLAIPSIFAGNLYLQTDAGAIACLDAASGRIRWLSIYDRAVFDAHRPDQLARMMARRPAGRIIVGQDTLFVAPRDALKVLCIRRKNGAIRWQRDLAVSRLLVGLAKSDDKIDRLIIQGTGLDCVNAKSGEALWNWFPNPEAGPIRGEAALGEKEVYVPSKNGICRIEIQSGMARVFQTWQQLGSTEPLGNLILRADSIIGFGRDRLVRFQSKKSPPNKSAVNEIKAIAEGQDDGEFRRVSLPTAKPSASLALRWHLGRARGRGLIRPADAGPDELYALTEDSIVRLRPAAARLDWRGSVPRDVTQIVVSKNRVLAVTPSEVIALDRANGDRQWSSTFIFDETHPRQWGLEVDAGPDAIAVRNIRRRDYYQILDAATGKLKSSFTVSQRGYNFVNTHMLAGRLLAVFRNRGSYLFEIRDLNRGSVLHSERVDLADTRHVNTFMTADEKTLYIHTGKKLFCYSMTERKVIWECQTEFEHQVQMRMEGDWLLLIGMRNPRDENQWTTFIIDPASGKIQFKQTGGYVFSSDYAFRIYRRDREHGHDYGAVCWNWRENRELWNVRGGDREDRMVQAMPLGDYFILVYSRDSGTRPNGERIHRLHYRLFDRKSGKFASVAELPGTTRQVNIDPSKQPFGRLVASMGGQLIFTTIHGVTAMGGLPPGPNPTQQFEHAASILAAAASAQPPSEREGAAEFLATHRRKTRPVYHSPRPIMVDGSLDDWTDIEPVTLDASLHLRSVPGSVPWRGPDDFSARLYLSWDEDRLYFAAEVLDDVFVPPAPGSNLISGDSLIVGISKLADLDELHSQNDLIFQIARVDGKLKLAHLGGLPLDSEFTSERIDYQFQRADRGYTYELSVPWPLLQAWQGEQGVWKRKPGLGVVLIDRDGSRSGQELEWGYGLLRGIRPAKFIQLNFVEQSRWRLATYRKFIDRLPAHPFSWRFLQRLTQTRGASDWRYRSELLEAFIKKYPQSDYAVDALRELSMLYRQAGFERTHDKITELAIKIGLDSDSLYHAKGAFMESNGVCVMEAENFTEATSHGDSVKWTLDKSVRGYVGEGFMAVPQGEYTRGRVWDKMSELSYHVHITTPGKYKIAVRMRTPDQRSHSAMVGINGLVRSRHTFTCSWANFQWCHGPTLGWLGEGVHTINLRRKERGFAIDRLIIANDDSKIDGGGSYDRGPSETPRSNTPILVIREGRRTKTAVEESPSEHEARLKLSIEGAHLISDSPEAVDLLIEAEGLYENLSGESHRQAVTGLYESFLRKNPKTPQAHRILVRLLTVIETYTESRRAAMQHCEALMDAIQIERLQRRAFYTACAEGIRLWKHAGYFDVGENMVTFDKVLPPENQPVDLNMIFKTGDDRMVEWESFQAEENLLRFMNHRTVTRWPLSYLWTKFESPRTQKALILFGYRGLGAVWMNGRPIAREQKLSWYKRDEFALPVILRKGNNEILLKIAHRDYDAKASCRLADFNGRPLEGIVERLPLGLLSLTTVGTKNQVHLEFSRPVDPAAANNIAHYRIEPEVSVAGASIQEDGKSVVLNTSELTVGKNYAITIRQIPEANPQSGSKPVIIKKQFQRTGTGKGLRGQYANDIGEDSSIRLTRIDSVINFDWGDYSPDEAIDDNNFAIIWNGKLQPIFTETYKIFTISDDGIRLYLEGKMIIDNWTQHPATENSAEVALEAGRKYDLKIEYCEAGGQAVIKLLWSSPSQPKQIIPQNQLYPPEE